MANSAEIDQALLKQLLELLEPQDAETRIRLMNTALMWFGISVNRYEMLPNRGDDDGSRPETPQDTD